MAGGRPPAPGGFYIHGGRMLGGASALNSRRTLNGVDKTGPFVFGGSALVPFNGRPRIGGAANGIVDFDGQIAEVILYSAPVTAVQRQQVNSYLAVKYGVTMGVNYLSPAVAVIYNRATFGRDIAGLGKDARSMLDQRISRSINTAATAAARPILTVSTDNIFTGADDTHADTLLDRQYLIWGRNNVAATVVRAAVVGGAEYEVLSRLWKYQDTGGTGPVNMQFNLAGLGLEFNGTPPQLVRSADAVIGNAGDVLVPGTVVGNTIVFTNVDLDDNTQAFFGLALQQVPQVAFNPAASTSVAAESAETVAARVDLSYLSNLAITVPYMPVAANTTATDGGVDYADVTTGSVTINAGAPSATVQLAINDDGFDEDDETVVLSLGTPTNASNAPINQAHTLTITDNDPIPTVRFNTILSMPGETPVPTVQLISVDLSAVSGRPVTVPYSFNVSSTATGGGADYTDNTAGSATIPAGSLNATIAIRINDDALDEPPETAVIDLGTPTNAGNAATNQTHTLTITDNDAAPQVQFNVIASAASESAGTAVITVDLSAASG